MRPLNFLLLVLGFMVLQSTALNLVAIRGIKPDLVLVLVILHGFFRGTREGAFWGFVGGVIQDLAGGGYFGIYAMTNMTGGYLAGLGEGRLYRDNRVIAAGLTWLCTFFAQLVYFLLLLIVEVRLNMLTALIDIIVPVCMYNALVVLLFYGFYYRARRQGLVADGEY